MLDIAPRLGIRNMINYVCTYTIKQTHARTHTRTHVWAVRRQWLISICIPEFRLDPET